MRIALAASIIAASSVAADTEIHRCLLDDGTFAFQEKPCAEPAVRVNEGSEADERNEKRGARAEDDVFDFVNPYDEPAGPPMSSEQALPEAVSHNRAECEKSTRDAIDTIDLEMRKKAYTKEQGQEFLAELLVLTRQLRACKQL